MPKVKELKPFKDLSRQPSMASSRNMFIPFGHNGYEYIIPGGEKNRTGNVQPILISRKSILIAAVRSNPFDNFISDGCRYKPMEGFYVFLIEDQDITIHVA